MEFWSRIKSALRNLFRKQQIESHLDQELRAYVEIVNDEKIAAGMAASDARRIALAELGGLEQVKQAVREDRAGTGIELLWQVSVRPAAITSQSRVHSDCGRHPGPGNWRNHCYLFRRVFSAAAATAVLQPQPAHVRVQCVARK